MARQSPPQPVVWHSKHYLEVHGVPIIQPKLKVIVEGKQQPIRTSFAGRDSYIPNEEQAGHHVIDMTKQPIKGFRVGE